MIGTLRKLYRRPEDVPTEVIEFLKQLDADNKLPTPQPNATLAEVQRAAGRRSLIDDALSYIHKQL
jgi:hypothetical protein